LLKNNGIDLLYEVLSSPNQDTQPLPLKMQVVWFTELCQGHLMSNKNQWIIFKGLHVLLNRDVALGKVALWLVFGLWVLVFCFGFFWGFFVFFF